MVLAASSLDLHRATAHVPGNGPRCTIRLGLRVLRSLDSMPMRQYCGNRTIRFEGIMLHYANVLSFGPFRFITRHRRDSVGTYAAIYAGDKYAAEPYEYLVTGSAKSTSTTAQHIAHRQVRNFIHSKSRER